MSRKVIMIQEMFDDIASNRERAKVNTMYETHKNKGAAVAYMTRKVLNEWRVMVGKTTTLAESKVRPRVIKVNSFGGSRVMAI